jgi:GNAT superfamily N-acetyltransferase
MMRRRAAVAPEFFLVAVDRETGKIAGFLNGLATNERTLRDDFFRDAGLHNPEGANVMLLGLDVLPAYRRQGLATEIMLRYLEREWKRGRKLVVLTCLEGKVGMYEKMGYRDLGISQSGWGGEQWHEMSCRLHGV